MKASRHHSSRIPTATNIALTETVDGATIRSVSHSVVTNTATIDAYRRETVRTDGRGNATHAEYNALGQKSASIDTLGNRTTYAYDRFGNLQIPRRSIETGNTALLSSVPTSASINFIKKSSSRSRRLNMNSKIFLSIATLLITSSGCASERLYVKVVDYEGHPVSNATVCVGFSTSYVLFGGGNTGGGSGGGAEACTDTNGNAVVKFNCKSSDFGWYVEADGYYRSDIRTEHFKGEDIMIPPAFGFVKLHEHEKHGNVILYRKKNPQPMYSYRLSEAYGNAMNKVPAKNGRYGFDLKLGAWLPPLGKGEVADFYYVRNIGEEPMEDGRVAWLEFDDGGGAYIGKQTGSKVFPSTYGANTNAVFKNRLPFMFVKNNSDDKRIDWRDIASNDEYVVLRTRVKLDPDGKIIKANYSKILGPFRFGYAVESPCVVFNHHVNDTNLESDCRLNMLKQFNSNGYPP